MVKGPGLKPTQPRLAGYLIHFRGHRLLQPLAGRNSGVLIILDVLIALADWCVLIVLIVRGVLTV